MSSEPRVPAAVFGRRLSNWGRCGWTLLFFCLMALFAVVMKSNDGEGLRWRAWEVARCYEDGWPGLDNAPELKLLWPVS